MPRVVSAQRPVENNTPWSRGPGYNLLALLERASWPKRASKRRAKQKEVSVTALRLL